jgi:hypothetical protein
MSLIPSIKSPVNRGVTKVRYANGCLGWGGTALRQRFLNQRRALGLGEGAPVEVFSLTSWGSVASWDQVVADFPAFRRQSR